jgi:hypothetical protein
VHKEEVISFKVLLRGLKASKNFALKNLNVTDETNFLLSNVRKLEGWRGSNGTSAQICPLAHPGSASHTFKENIECAE